MPDPIREPGPARPQPGAPAGAAHPDPTDATARPAEAAHGPLAGIRVADFSRVLAGPYATMLLADFGADVIKIEPPALDETRAWAPPVDARGGSTYFGAVNRNKRAVTLDLTEPAGLAEARRLAASADVVVENFRPGVMARYGLDFDTLRQTHPGLVYCSITGFGADATLPGYDLLVQATGGLMSLTGEPGGQPVKAGVALVDVLTGQNALAGILLALRERERTGIGARVEVSLLQSLLSGLVNQASATLATGESPARHGNAHPSIAPYATFAAADRPLVIAVGNDKQFAALAAVLGAPELAADPRFRTNRDRVAARAALTAELEARLAARPAHEWADALVAAGVPAGLVNTVAEGIAFAEALGLDPVAVAPEGDRSIAAPIRLHGAAPAVRRRPPDADEHRGADWADAR